MTAATQFYGWPVETLQDQPGVTLHGGDPPSSPRLPDAIEGTVRGLELRIAALEAQVADLTTRVDLAEEILVRQQSEQSVSASTTPVDTGLTFDAEEANAIYMVRLRVRWAEASGGGGFRATWAAPAGSSSLRAIVAPGQDATTGPQALTTAQIRAWVHNQEVFTSSDIATSTTHGWYEDMLLIAGGPGPVTFRFAQGTSESGATTLNAASYLVYRRLG